MKRYYFLFSCSLFFFIFSTSYCMNLHFMTDLDGFWHAYEVKKTQKSKAAITERNLKIAHNSYNATTTQKGGKYHHLVVFEYNGIIDHSADNCFNFRTRSSALNFISKRTHNRDISDAYQNINNLTQGTGKMLYYDTNISVLEYKRQNKLVIYTRLI